MAKHKAPTEVTVAPLFEKSVLEKTLDRYKGPAVAVILGAVIWVLYNHFTNQRSRKDLDQSWETLIAATTPDPMTGLPSAAPDTLAGLAETLRDQESGPWARLLEVEKRIAERDLDGALHALQLLRQEHPDHPLVTSPVRVGEEALSVADRLQRVVEERKAWEGSHPGLFENPPPPEGSPHVLLKTSAGEIELALYADRAPQHVENFLKLCREGFYSETKFHRVVRGFMIQGGDPNSKEDDTSTWGNGGPGYNVPPEETGLYHFAAVLSAAKKPGDAEESGSQFFLTTDPAHHLDGQHTVFGQVVRGMDVVRSLAEAPLAEGSRDRPMNPAVIQSAEVLE